MEGGNQRLGYGGVAGQVFDAFAHLGRGLVGEGDGQNRVRGDPLLLDQPRDAAGDDARFAGACSGKDQQRAFSGFDCGTLFGIEIGEERGHDAGPERRVQTLVYLWRQSRVSQASCGQLKSKANKNRSPRLRWIADLDERRCLGSIRELAYQRSSGARATPRKAWPACAERMVSNLSSRPLVAG